MTGTGIEMHGLLLILVGIPFYLACHIHDGKGGRPPLLSFLL